MPKLEMAKISNLKKTKKHDEVKFKGPIVFTFTVNKYKEIIGIL